jgi:hypothetical protein
MAAIRHVLPLHLPPPAGGVQAAFDVSGGFKSSLHSSNSRCRLLFGFWHGGYTSPAA